jgi:hypothetical protein
MLAELGLFRLTGIRGPALVRVELLLDYSLRPRLLTGRLMFRLKLHFARFTDSDDRDILDSLYDPKTARGHGYSFPQLPGNCVISFASRQDAVLPDSGEVQTLRATDQD